MGMLIGMGIVSAVGIIASGGLIALVLCVVIGLGLGRYFGKKIRKCYKDIANDMGKTERMSFRAWAIMSQFYIGKKKMEKETVVRMVEMLVYEGKQALSVKDAKMELLIKKYGTPAF